MVRTEGRRFAEGRQGEIFDGINMIMRIGMGRLNFGWRKMWKYTGKAKAGFGHRKRSESNDLETEPAMLPFSFEFFVTFVAFQLYQWRPVLGYGCRGSGPRG